MNALVYKIQKRNLSHSGSFSFDTYQGLKLPIKDEMRPWKLWTDFLTCRTWKWHRRAEEKFHRVEIVFLLTPYETSGDGQNKAVNLISRWEWKRFRSSDWFLILWWASDEKIISAKKIVSTLVCNFIALEVWEKYPMQERARIWFLRTLAAQLTKADVAKPKNIQILINKN